MRLLHTSDWHLGRSFHRVGMLDAQAAVLDHLVEVVRAERVDAVLVAGDVYDRALPAVDAVALLDEALARLRRHGRAGRALQREPRLGPPAGLRAPAAGARRGVHVRTDPARCGDPVLLEDRYGAVAIYPLPYLEPALAGPALGLRDRARARGGADGGDGRRSAPTWPRDPRAPGRSWPRTRSSSAASRATASATSASAASARCRPASSTASTTSRSGTCTAGSGSARRVRYSGSPLAYSFSEHAHTKGSWLVELGAGGAVERVDAVDGAGPAPAGACCAGRSTTCSPTRRSTRHEDAWCQVTLTDASGRPTRWSGCARASRTPSSCASSPAAGRAAGTLHAADRRAGRPRALLRLRRARAARRPATPSARCCERRRGARVALARESGVAPLRPAARWQATGGGRAARAGEERAAA